jgi:2-polyprenyl-3-methyl-5-hydroxy-6-metoxy-1,4-benzoquinol methylase
MLKKVCICGNADLGEFSPGYLRCTRCETLVARRDFDRSISYVTDDATDLYGREYWYSHQREMGYPDIETRARQDLPERCVHWLATLLKYKRPPAKLLELGCAHGGFVALARWYGFDAVGLDLSPTITKLAVQTFEIPVLTGPLEKQQFSNGSFDVIAAMDVVEHLPYPRLTMQRCLDLLKNDGILMIQTPRYREGRTLSSMVADRDSFLELFKDDGHLYLFSASSLKRMFAELGALEMRQECPIFAQYDQFVVVGKSILGTGSDVPECMDAARTPARRLVEALIDSRSHGCEMQERWSEAEADRAARLAVIEDLSLKLEASEADRQARLAVIEDLSRNLEASEADRQARLAVIEDLSLKLEASEADRQARLAVIEDLSRNLEASEADRADRLTVIEDLSLKLEASEADRAARLAVIEDLSRKLDASEADRATRLAVIEDLSRKLDASEADRTARLAVIEDLSLKLIALREREQNLTQEVLAFQTESLLDFILRRSARLWAKWT